MPSVVKKPPTNAGDFRNTGFFLGWEDPLEEGMSMHFVFLPGRISRIEEFGIL